MNLFDHMRCEFSPDRVYRYCLRRTWELDNTPVVFIGLNPSIADETIDDPTIRRCCNFAKDWGFGGIIMLNLFAFRATDPEAMKKADDPVGPMNDAILKREILIDEPPLVVAAWGTHGVFKERCYYVESLLRGSLSCLLRSKDGHPMHPLYLHHGLKPQPFSYEKGAR
jgi:hypothetical protein